MKNKKLYVVIAETDDAIIAIEKSSTNNTQVVAQKKQKTKKPAAAKTINRNAIQDHKAWANFVANINWARRFYGMTEREFAALTGMSQSSINSILNGKQRPRRENAEKIARSLGFSVKALEASPVAVSRLV